MRLSKEVSDRISMLRPLLIIGVIFVHIAGISDAPSQLVPGAFNWFAAVFKNGVFRGTVPTMSLISGYLLFNAGLDKNIQNLFRKKFTTLAIPFVIFNIYYFLFMVGAKSAMGVEFVRLPVLQQRPLELLLTIFGITEFPINGPLHFVRDMMVAVMLVPLLSFFLRKFPWVGLVLLLAIFGTDVDGLLIFRASSLILFYIGGAGAIYRWDVLAFDKYAKPFLAVFLAGCLTMVAFRIDDNTILVTASPFLIWPAASLLQKTKLEAWAIRFCKYSFFIFVAHMPIIETLWYGVLHYARWIPYPIYWFAAPILTVAFLKVTYDFAMKMVPKEFNLIIGARTGKPIPVDRRRAPREANALVYSAETRLILANR